MNDNYREKIGLLKKCYHAKILKQSSSNINHQTVDSYGNIITEESEQVINSENDTRQYDTPYELKLNYQPTKDKYFENSVGEYAKQTMKIVCPKKRYKGVFVEKDLLYLDGYSPQGEEYNGQNANYIIESVRNYRLNIVIYAKRISSKDSLRLGEMEMDSNFQKISNE